MIEKKNNPTSDSERLRKKIQDTFHDTEPKKSTIYQDTVKDLNAKILQITLMIREQFPELSKYVEEMPVTVPDEKNPEIIKRDLKNYYDSLNSTLSKYKLEHPYLTKK